MLEGLPPAPHQCLFLRDNMLAEKRVSGDSLSLKSVPRPTTCTGQGRACWVCSAYSCPVSSVKSPCSARQLSELSLIINIKIHPAMTGVFGFILCCLLLLKILFPKPTAKNKGKKKVFSVLLSVDIQQNNCPGVNSFS